MKKQKDVTHKHQIFQKEQKTDTLCKKQIVIVTRGEFQKNPKNCIIVCDLKYLLNFTSFRIYDFIKTYFAEVTTLSQEFIMLG